MPTHPLLQVDASTSEPLAGNACAVVLDAQDLDAARMRAVAREMNLSETAFVLPSRVADARGEEICTVSTGTPQLMVVLRDVAAPAFEADQGHCMVRPGRAHVEVLGLSGAIEGVRVGGRAVTVARGELLV